MSAWKARFQAEALDLVELVLVPGLAAVLPWGFCYRVFRFLSRFDFLYRESCNQTYPFARRHGWFQDLALWQRHRRLVMMVDHADFYLALTRSLRWTRRHVETSGDWPAPGKASLLCSFHWGCGMWALWLAGAAGLRPHALVAPLRPDIFPGRMLRYRYYRARNRVVARALRNDPLDTAASLRPMLKALRAEGQVLALLDVPPNQVAASVEIDFLGLRARMPSGVLRVAVEQGIPITLFINGFRLGDGHRFLRLIDIGVPADLDSLTRQVFACLEGLIREEPALWHYWEVADQFFTPP